MILTQTADGSQTLYLPEIDEHYHSSKGAFTESEHIFINNGYCMLPNKEITVFEVGLGTGLNALLTCQKAYELQQKTLYVCIEAFPVNISTINLLGYEKLFYNAPQFLNKIHAASWDTIVHIHDYFSIQKIKDDFTIFTPVKGIDVVYFDAFSPEKQPEMWTVQMFNKLFNCMSKGAVLTTYCAKGQVRRNMKETGFKVERIAGPPGKREMLRAIKE